MLSYAPIYVVVVKKEGMSMGSPEMHVPNIQQGLLKTRCLRKKLREEKWRTIRYDTFTGKSHIIH